MEEEVPQESLYQRRKREAEARRAAAPVQAPVATPEVDPDDEDDDAFLQRAEAALAQPPVATEDQRFEERAIASKVAMEPEQGPMPDGEVTAPTRAALPEFRNDIYEGMDPQDAEALYGAYLKHADTTDESTFGGLFGATPTYKGKPVYAPSKAAAAVRDEKADIKMRENNAIVGDVVKVAAHNALQDTEELGVALAEGAVDMATFKSLRDRGGEGLGWTEAYNKAYPEMKTKRAEDQWYADAVGMGIGAFGGAGALKATGAAAKAANAVAKNGAGPYVVKMAEWITRSLGTAAGTAVTSDNDQENMLMGPNGLAKGLSFDGSGAKTATNVLKKRLNVFIDSTAMAFAGDGALTGLKAGAKLVGDRLIKPIYGMMSQGTRENMIMDNLMKSIYAVTESTTPKQMAKIKEDMTKILSDPDNYEAVFGLDELGEIKYKRDTVTTLERGYEKILQQLDTLPDGPEKLREQERIGALIERMQSTRKSVSGEGSKTHTALGRPQHGVEEKLTRAETEGAPYVEGAAEAIQGEARTQGEMAGLGMDLAVSQREQLDQAIPGLVKDPKNKLGARLSANPRPEDELFEREASTQKVLTDVADSREVTKRTQNKLFDDVAQTKGFEMNQTSWNNNVNKVSHLFPENIKKILDDTHGSYGEMYQKVRGPLNDAINKLQKGVGVPEQDAHKALLSLKEELMETQLDYMRTKAKATGNTDLATAVQTVETAEDFFLNESTKFRRGVTQKLKDAETKFDPAATMDDQSEVLQKELRNEHGSQLKEFIDLTKSDPLMARRGTAADVYDVAVSDMAKDIAAATRQSGVVKGAAAIEKITDKYMQMLSHDPVQAKRIAKFKDELLANKTSAEDLDKMIKGPLQDQLDSARDRIYGEVFKDFVDKQGLPKTNTWQSFKKLLNDPDSVGETLRGNFDEVLDAVKNSGDPMLIKGVKSAWAKNLGEKIKVKGNIAPAALEETLTGNNPILKQAEKLWGKDFAENMSRVLNEIHGAETGMRVAGIGTSEYGFGEKVVKQAVQKGINIMYGRLSRKGAQLSSVMSAVIDQMDTAEMRNTVLQRIFENPDEFAKLLDKAKVYDDNAAKQAFRQWAYGLSRNETDSDKKRAVDRQTEEALR